MLPAPWFDSNLLVLSTVFFLKKYYEMILIWETQVLRARHAAASVRLPIGFLLDP